MSGSGDREGCDLIAMLLLLQPWTHCGKIFGQLLVLVFCSFVFSFLPEAKQRNGEPGIFTRVIQRDVISNL